jgi:hypothetical protein
MLSMQILVVGLVVLVLLAVINGAVEGRAQRRAWRLIATQRREIQLARQELENAPRCRCTGPGEER